MERFPYLDWVPWRLVGWYAVVLVVYYVLMVRTLLQMLEAKPNPVLPVFALLALFPAPPVVLVGIVIMILWAIHRRSL